MKKLLIITAAIMLVGVGCSSGGINDPVDDQVIGSSIVDRSNQNLTSFPKSLLNQSGIEELDISGNQMTGALPAEIGQLSRLRVLDASNNQFTGIPAEVGQLNNLEVLDYSNNQLTGIPNELGNLSNLKILDFSGNDISEHDLGVIREALPASVEIRL